MDTVLELALIAIAAMVVTAAFYFWDRRHDGL